MNFFILLIGLMFTIFAENSSIQYVSDPIDKIVQNLNSDKNDMWLNGIYPIIELSAEAKPKEIIAEAIKICRFDKGHIKNYKIIEIRKVKLNAHGMEDCSAALIESDLGVSVLLFQYVGNSVSSTWWTRWFDTEEKIISHNKKMHPIA